jgi:hypothetical protein
MRWYTNEKPCAGPRDKVPARDRLTAFVMLDDDDSSSLVNLLGELPVDEDPMTFVNQDVAVADVAVYV